MSTGDGERVSTSFRLRPGVVEGLRQLAQGIGASQGEVIERLVRHACHARGLVLPDDLPPSSLAPVSQPAPPSTATSSPAGASTTVHVPGQLPLIPDLDDGRDGRPPLAATHDDLAALDVPGAEAQGDGSEIWLIGECWACLSQGVPVRSVAAGKPLCKTCGEPHRKRPKNT